MWSPCYASRPICCEPACTPDGVHSAMLKWLHTWSLSLRFPTMPVQLPCATSCRHTRSRCTQALARFALGSSPDNRPRSRGCRAGSTEPRTSTTLPPPDARNKAPATTEEVCRSDSVSPGVNFGSARGGGGGSLTSKLTNRATYVPAAPCGPGGCSQPCGHTACPSSEAFIAENANMHTGMAIRFTCDANVDFVRGMVRTCGRI